jgi:hypothetical protein
MIVGVIFGMSLPFDSAWWMLRAGMASLMRFSLDRMATVTSKQPISAGAELESVR